MFTTDLVNLYNRNIFKPSLYIYIFQDEKCRLMRNLSLSMSSSHLKLRLYSPINNKTKVELFWIIPKLTFYINLRDYTNQPWNLLDFLWRQFFILCSGFLFEPRLTRFIRNPGFEIEINMKMWFSLLRNTHEYSVNPTGFMAAVAGNTLTPEDEH